MTATVYNQDGRWDIPAYVWPAVLGTSVAVHISFLIFGLPSMVSPSEQQPRPPEPELIIESGGLEFESISNLQPVNAESAPVAQRIEKAPVDPLEPEISQAETVQASKPDEEALAPVNSNSQIEKVTPTAVPSNGETARVETVVAEPNRVDTASSVAPVTTVDPTVQSNVVAAAKTVLSTPDVAVVAAAPTIVTTVETAVSLGPQSVKVNGAGGVAVAPVSNAPPAVAATEPVIATSAAETPQTVQKIETMEPVTVVSAQEPEAVQTIQEVQVATAVEAVAPVSTVEDQQGVVVTQPENIIVQSPRVTATFEASPELVTGPEIPKNSVESVRPVEQQIAAVSSVDVVHETLTPSETEASPISSAQPEGDPTDTVPAVEVASIDPLAKTEAYVGNYNLGSCAHMTVMSAGADTATVTAYGAGPEAFILFDKRFSADQGYEANIELRLVSDQQCALLDSIGVSSGIEVAGLVDLDRSVVRSGSIVSGVIQRDLPLNKIAAANAAGLGLDGKGPPEVYLIDGGGQIHDGRQYILPESNTVRAGGWRFQVPVTLKSSDEQETALVLAIWNRPQSRQPGRFGTLPANRISDLLAEPGVFSLAAFKVSR